MILPEGLVAEEEEESDVLRDELMAKKISIIKLDDRNIKMVVDGFPVAFVNSVRRAVLSDVPTLAIDFAFFYDNTSSVYDEIIAHRLGLTVLKSDDAIKKYKSPEECSDADETDTSCYVEIIIRKEISEDSEKGEYVKASDMEIPDPNVSPAYPETPIVYLAPGQRVHIVAYARLGRGREHGKWSPASVSVLRNVPVLSIVNKGKIDENCVKCLEAYPEVLKSVRRSRSKSIELSNLEKTGGLRYCIENVCKDALRLEYSENKFILEVEGTGALRPESIVYEALKALELRAKVLKEVGVSRK